MVKRLREIEQLGTVDKPFREDGFISDDEEIIDIKKKPRSVPIADLLASDSDTDSEERQKISIRPKIRPRIIHAVKQYFEQPIEEPEFRMSAPLLNEHDATFQFGIEDADIALELPTIGQDEQQNLRRIISAPAQLNDIEHEEDTNMNQFCGHSLESSERDEQHRYALFDMTEEQAEAVHQQHPDLEMLWVHPRYNDRENGALYIIRNYMNPRCTGLLYSVNSVLIADGEPEQDWTFVRLNRNSMIDINRLLRYPEKAKML